MARTTNLPEGTFDTNDSLIGNDGQRTSRFGANDVIDITETQITSRVVTGSVPIKHEGRFVSSFLENTLTMSQEYGSSTPATISDEVVYLNAEGRIVMTATIATAINSAITGTDNQKVVLINHTAGYVAEYFINNDTYSITNNVLDLGYALNHRLGATDADVAALGVNSDLSTTISIATSTGITINGVELETTIRTGEGAILTQENIEAAIMRDEAFRMAIGAGTSNLELGTTSTTALAGDTTIITQAQADAIVANTAKRTYPAADETKVGFITITQPVDLDTLETDVATNSSKASITITNAVGATPARVTDGTITLDIPVGSVGVGITFPGDASWTGIPPEEGDIFYLTAVSGSNNPGLYYYFGSTWSLATANFEITQEGVVNAITNPNTFRNAINAARVDGSNTFMGNITVDNILRGVYTTTQSYTPGASSIFVTDDTGIETGDTFTINNISYTITDATANELKINPVLGTLVGGVLLSGSNFSVFGPVGDVIIDKTIPTTASDTVVVNRRYINDNVVQSANESLRTQYFRTMAEGDPSGSDPDGLYFVGQ